MDDIYYDNAYDNNNNEIIELTDEELLNILNDEMNKIDEFVDILWNNVILKYIETNKTVLSKLTELDKHKFKMYIIKNSKVYKSILSDIKILKNNIESPANDN